MRNFIPSRRVRAPLASVTIVACSIFAGLPAAFAGECPADKFKADVRAPVTHEAKGVTDTVLGAIDLEKVQAA